MCSRSLAWSSSFTIGWWLPVRAGLKKGFETWNPSWTSASSNCKPARRSAREHMAGASQHAVLHASTWLVRASTPFCTRAHGWCEPARRFCTRAHGWCKPARRSAREHMACASQHAVSAREHKPRASQHAVLHASTWLVQASTPLLHASTSLVQACRRRFWMMKHWVHVSTARCPWVKTPANGHHIRLFLNRRCTEQQIWES